MGFNAEGAAVSFGLGAHHASAKRSVQPGEHFWIGRRCGKRGDDLSFEACVKGQLLGVKRVEIARREATPPTKRG